MDFYIEFEMIISLFLAQKTSLFSNDLQHRKQANFWRISSAENELTFKGEQALKQANFRWISSPENELVFKGFLPLKMS